MLKGGEVTVAGSGTNFTVNGESVVCGNVQTSNLTVYMVDTVLMPQSWAPGPAPFPRRNRARSRAFPPRRDARRSRRRAGRRPLAGLGVT
jgi:hypothetical protein